MTPKLTAVGAAIALVFAAGQAQANGTDPTVVSGQASFATQGKTLSITNSPGAIIHWQGFSIGASEITRFVQQNAASSVLNRVIGPDPSVILGTLTSNGRVFLINPSGILVGTGAYIDVAGLVASTLNLSNQDFLAGRLNFAFNPLAGKVENQGTITTPSGGSVYLVGSDVTNSGIINSPQGDVILAAGQSVKIFDTSTPGVRVELTATENAAVNLGQILAQSGQIGIYGAALRNPGLINADQVVKDASGKIVLRAKQDATLEAGSRLSASGEQAGEITVQSETGTTLVSGTIEARGTGAEQTGGKVHILGQAVNFAGAAINVSGDAGGGTVLVGGNFHGTGPEQNSQSTSLDGSVIINADAINSGNGGRIAVWSDNHTSIGGTLTARGGANSGDGGFIETSGKHVLLADGTRVNTLAPHGKTGLWLLDPTNWTIDSTVAAEHETPASVVTSLASSDRTILADNDITVAEAVAWTTPQTLTLNAGHDVLVNAAMTASTAGAGIVLIAGNDVTATAALTASALGAVIDMSAGHNVSVGVVTASGGGSVNLRANNDVIVNGLITADTGLDSVKLLADNEGTGPGVGGGTVTFVGTGAVVTPRTIIRFNPNGYINTTAEIAAYASKVSAILDAKAWVFAQGDNKTYDGTNVASLSLKDTPTATLVSGAATFDNPGGKNVATGKPITFNGYTVVDAEYALFAGTGTTTANIIPRALTVTAASDTKTYDRTTSSAGVPTHAALQSGDTTTTFAQTFDNWNAGTGKTLTAAGIVNDGNSGNNYSYTFVTDTSGVIDPLAVTLTAPDVSKTYDGGLAYTTLAGDLTALTTPLLSGDTVTAATIAYANRNAGSGNKTVTVDAATISDGNSGNNYAVTLAGNSTSTITARALTVTAASDTKTYDRTTSSAGVPTHAALQSGDTTTTFAQTFDNWNAGTGKTLTAAGIVNDGNSGNNYSYTFVTDTSGVINVRAITGSITAANKVYDATDVATITGRSLSGAISGDDVSYSGGAASFDNKNAGTGKTVTGTGLIVSGADAGNYTVNSSATTTADITKAALTISAAGQNKAYDATPSATVTLADNRLGDDVLSLGYGAASFNDKNIGVAKTVAVTGIALGGADADNYSFNTTASTTADITALAITGTITAANKVYDASDAATITGRSVAGVLGADVVSYSGGTANFDNKNAGTGKTVTGTGLGLTGANAGNYTVNSTATSQADITPAPLDITANSATRVYGDTNPAFAATYIGLQNGESATTLAGTLVFATPAVPSSNVGNYAIIPSGQSSTNYTISYINGTLNVAPVSLMVTADAKSKVYGASDPVLTFGTTGLVNNPALGVVDTAGTVLSGTLTRAGGETVLGGPYVITQGTLATNSNYTLSSFTGNTLTISPVPLNVAANPQSKLFGTPDPALTFGVTGLVNNPALGIADTADTVFSGALTRVPGESALGGPYPISQGTLAANNNYTLGFTPDNLTIIGAAAETVLGFEAGQVVFAGVINNSFYYRPGNFWHISLNPSNADPGFDVMRGTNDLKSRLGDRLNSCDSVSGGGFCETWSFPEQREKFDNR